MSTRSIERGAVNKESDVNLGSKLLDLYEYDINSHKSTRYIRGEAIT